MFSVSIGILFRYYTTSLIILDSTILVLFLAFLVCRYILNFNSNYHAAYILKLMVLLKLLFSVLYMYLLIIVLTPHFWYHSKIMSTLTLIKSIENVICMIFLIRSVCKQINNKRLLTMDDLKYYYRILCNWTPFAQHANCVIKIFIGFQLQLQPIVSSNSYECYEHLSF